MPKYTQEGRALEVSTPLGKDVLLMAEFWGREAISQPFQFQLDLLAERGQRIAFDKLLGQKVTVRLALGGNRNRYFNGIVSHFSQGSRDAEFTRFHAELVPQLWLLTHRAQSRIFQHISIPVILKEVLAGLDVKYELQGTFHPRDFCVQYRESDFAFVSRLMEEEGIYYFFKHAANGHQMVVANTPASHPELPEQSKIAYEESAGSTRARCRITDWEKVQELRPGKYTVWDHCFELPGKKLEAQKAISDSVAVGTVTHHLRVGGNDQLEIYDYPGGYAHHYHGIDRGGGERPAHLQKIFEANQQTAAIRMQQEALLGLTIRGAGYCRQFVSGHKFTLVRHFDGDGPYVLTSVEHSIKLAGGYRSDMSPAMAYTNRFTCIPYALPFRPPRTTPRPTINGSQTAIVVGPPGEEVYTDKYGRVKVQFHWDRQGKSDADSSCWVRVATIWAGKRRGVIHIPMVGDEVVVDFLEGDPDRPLIIGSVYNAEMMPPFPLPENKTVIGSKDRSGSNTITVHPANKKTGAKPFYSLDLDHDFKVTVANDETIDVKGKAQLLVGGDRYVQADYYHVSAKKINLVAQEEIQLLTSDAKIIIGNGVITIQGSLVRINCGGV
jgi:type VI secretion system secreted protein VgrG